MDKRRLRSRNRFISISGIIVAFIIAAVFITMVTFIIGILINPGMVGEFFGKIINGFNSTIN